MVLNMRGVLTCVPLVCICALLASVTGCGRDPGVELQTIAWKHIDVDYLPGDKSATILKSWSTNDSAGLEELRRSFVVTYSGELYNVPEMTTNRILVKLDDGREFVVHIYEPHLLSVYDKNDTSVSFSLRVDPSFVRTLKAMIHVQTGDEVYFYSYEDH